MKQPAPLELVIVLGISTGSVGLHVRSLVQRLPALGVNVTVAAPAATAERFGFAESGAGFVPVEIATGPRPQQDLTAVRALRRLFARADVVHAHGLRAAGLSGVALGHRRHGRTPLVATWHDPVPGEMPKRILMAGLETVAARRADVTLGVSSDLVEQAGALGSPDARLTPLAAPALTAPLRGRAAVRAELGAGNRPVVLAVGRLAARKDYDTLLTAVAWWGVRYPQPLVVIAGEGPEDDRLRSVIDDFGLEVRMLGHREDVADLLDAADLYVTTATWEGQASVVRQAMSAGVPVVATAVGGIPDLVGEDALTVAPQDPKAVADAVISLLDDPDRRIAMAVRGRARAERWPDEGDIARAAEFVYSELVARHGVDTLSADDVAVIIPASDDQDHIVATVEAASKIEEVDVVVVVDNGSTDRTAELAAQAGAVVVNHAHRRDRAAAMETGASVVALLERREIGRQAPRALLFLDADLGESAGSAGPLIEPILAATADMTIAAPLDEHAQGDRAGLADGLARRGIERATGWTPTRPLSGPRCLTRRAFESAAPLTAGSGLETGLTVDLLRQGFRVTEVGVAFHHLVSQTAWKAGARRGRQYGGVLRALVTRRIRPAASRR